MAVNGDSGPLGILQRFVKRKRDDEEHCDLCSARLGHGHQHLWEASKRLAVCYF